MTDGGPQSLAALIRAARRDFPDLDFVAPGGVLDLRQSHRKVQRVRIEGGPGQFLHLQALGLRDGAGDWVSDAAAVTTSSWYKDYREKLEVSRLLDVEHPGGTTVHTGADEAPWCEVTLHRPTDLSGIRLVNVSGSTATRARGLRVLVQVADSWLVAYDHAARVAELGGLLTEPAGPLHLPRLELSPVLTKAFAGDYTGARTDLDAMKDLSDEERKEFRTTVSSNLLADRSLEWTIHGPQRCFRFWSQPEKVRYTQSAVEIASALATLTPNVCFGFGAALCVVRDHDLIPHDDDLDLIIGFDPHEAGSLPEGLTLVEQHLRPLGFTVSGNFSAHRHVKRGAVKHVDVFVGLFEGDTISWYPGTRGALDRRMMFPVSHASLLGVPVPLPRDPVTYLERLYGPGWRHPDPDFSHTWDRSAYADLAKRRR